MCGLIPAVLASTWLVGCDAFRSPDARVELAQEHFAKGEYGPAVTQLKQALLRDPAHARARLELGRVSLWLGDYESAAMELARALSAGAAAAEVVPLQLEVLLAQGKLDEAAANLARTDVLPTVRRLVFEARLAGTRGEFAQAKEKLRLALQEAPDDYEAIVESARVAAADGDLEPALAVPDKLVGQPDEVIARGLMLRGAALMSRGDFAGARSALGDALEKGKLMRVSEQLGAAVMLTDANLALNDIARAERSLATVTRWAPESLPAHYYKARIAMMNGNFSAAVAECQRALRLQPEHVQSQLLLAAAHMSQGSLEQAQNTLERVLFNNPQNTAARKLLAQVHLARNRPQEAQNLLASLGADPDLDWLRGQALMRTGNVASGIEHLERSVAAAANDPSRQIALASAYIANREPQKALELLHKIPVDSPASGQAKALEVLATAAGQPPAQAKREIETLLRQRPDDAELASAAGSYLAVIGDMAASRRVLERALELDASNIQARLSLARLDAAAGDLFAAEQHLLDIIRLEPTHEAARLGLAEIAWVRGDRASARKYLEEAISTKPDAVQARLRLAQVAFMEGDPNRARSLLDQVLKVAEDRKSMLTATGRVLARAGLTDEALARFREASAAGDREALLLAADLHSELGQSVEARRLIESALRQYPGWRKAEETMVELDAREGRIEPAIERARKLAGAVSPGRQRTIEGEIYLLAGRTKDALSAYEAAHRAEPSTGTALRVFSLRRATAIAAPERVLEEWLARAPNDAVVRRQLASYYQSTGQADRAIAHYEALLSRDQADPPSLNNLAWLLHGKGDSRALDLARRAYEAAPHVPEIGDTYGWILVRMGKVSEGLAVLQSALVNAPNNPDILYHLAEAHRQAGNVVRAEQLVNQALKPKHDFTSRREAEQLARDLAERRNAG